MDISFLKAKHFIQAQRIWRRQAMALCFSGLIGFKSHVKHKEADQARRKLPKRCLQR